MQADVVELVIDDRRAEDRRADDQVRRSADDAILALRQQVRAWVDGSATPDVRVLVYPPEREAEMLARLPQVVEDLAAEGPPVDLVDLGRILLDELRQERGSPRPPP